MEVKNIGNIGNIGTLEALNTCNPGQSVYLKFCTTSHHYDMHVHLRFP